MKRIFLVLMALIFILLTGCGNSKDVESANEVAVDFIESFKRLDFNRMYSMTKDMAPYYSGVYNSEEELNVKVFKAFAEHLEYSITETEIKGNEANVFYHLRALDAQELMRGIVEATTNEPNGDIDLIIEKQVRLCPRIEKDTVLNMERLGQTWVIESNVGIYDDLCGGFIQFCYNLGFAQNLK